MGFEHIPAEMREFRQWIVWRLEEQGGPKPTKVPYSPLVAGAKAAVDRPGTWGAFEDAVSAFKTGLFSGIGFVLTSADPYGFVDLDDTKGDEELIKRQQRIYEALPSYAERSPSGTGLHIIVKGSVPRGRKRDQIEVYSELRYMTMTGDVYRDAPIIDCQDELTLLWYQMGGPASVHSYAGDTVEREDDATVVGRARSALNGDKFVRLYNGDYQTDYGPDGRSEGDQALVDIVAFYTQNRAQIERIWLGSGLGNREKVQKRADYRKLCIDKAFDKMLAPVDTSGLLLQLQEMNASEPMFEGIGAPAEGPTGAPVLVAPGGTTPHVQGNARTGQGVSQPPLAVNGASIVFPPGLVGQVAQFIYDAAPRPVKEIALVGALGFVAGIVGRAYNISFMGLNFYVLCLAPTGTGKEAINAGISKLVSAARETVGAIDKYVGPGDTRSDAALIKWLAKEPCIFSVQGEWGMRLKQMSSPYANSNEIGVKKVIMDLFNKSGYGNILSPLAYSDGAKNTPPIPNPSFTLIGESTPERFYEALDELMIADGLLPRFLTIEYTGDRPPRNRNPINRPEFGLIENVGRLVTHCQTIAGANSVVNIALDPYAEKILDDFSDYADERINDKSGGEVTRHMWNRAHVKALKLAGVVATGINPFHPVVDAETAKWACDLVVRDALNIVDRFTRGEIGSSVLGSSERRQMDDMIATIRKWIILDQTGTECAKYGMPGNMHAAGIVLGSALNKRLVAMASYRLDKQGATNAINRTLKHMLDGDELRELPKAQMTQMFGTTARGFAISKPSTFS